MKVKFIVFSMVLSCVGAAMLYAQDDHSTHGNTGTRQSVSEHSGMMKKDALEKPLSGEVEVGNKICPVSGENIKAMGAGVKYEYEGKIYNFCCSGCIKKFKNNPEKYIKIIEENMKK